MKLSAIFFYKMCIVNWCLHIWLKMNHYGKKNIILIFKRWVCLQFLRPSLSILSSIQRSVLCAHAYGVSVQFTAPSNFLSLIPLWQTAGLEAKRFIQGYSLWRNDVGENAELTAGLKAQVNAELTVRLNNEVMKDWITQLCQQTKAILTIQFFILQSPSLPLLLAHYSLPNCCT